MPDPITYPVALTADELTLGVNALSAITLNGKPDDLRRALALLDGLRGKFVAALEAAQKEVSDA